MVLCNRFLSGLLRLLDLFGSLLVFLRVVGGSIGSSARGRELRLRLDPVAARDRAGLLLLRLALLIALGLVRSR
jgi:hypothetical protein